MSTWEVGLAEKDFEAEEGDRCSIKKADEEGVSVAPSSLADYPIIYHYLTFETELPTVSTLRLSNQNASSAPSPPNLQKYISPFTWSEPRKTYITYLSCAVTVTTAYSAGAYGSASAQLSDYWKVSQVAVYVGITTFTTGFAIAPMVLAPFSEINGRYPVFVVTGLLFVLCQLFCAITRSYPGMLVARFFLGVGGSTFSTMVGGVVSDIYQSEDRNKPMALFTGWSPRWAFTWGPDLHTIGAALFGTGLGPLCSGFIAQNVSWRWVFYVQTMSCAFLILCVIVFFKETRGSVLLSRRAQMLNQWYEQREEAGYVGCEMPRNNGMKNENQRIRWKVKSDEERETLAKMISISVRRPFREFATSFIFRHAWHGQTYSQPSRLSSFSHFGYHSAGQYYI